MARARSPRARAREPRAAHRIELVAELDAHEAEALRLELRRLVERHAPGLEAVRVEVARVRARERLSG